MTRQAILRHLFVFQNTRNCSGNTFMRSGLVGLFLLIGAPAFAGETCKEQVDAAFAKLRGEKAFRLETTIKNTDGMLKMKADYVLPDRMRQTVTLGGDGVPMEMVVIGRKAWSNQGGGWAELPQNFADKVAEQIKETVAEAPKVATDYKCIGDKDFEGKTYALYQAALAMPLSADAKDKGPRVTAMSVPNLQNVYIDRTTGLPVRNIVTPVTDPNKRLYDGTFSVDRDLTIDPPSVSAN
jgi:hypothetical protein